MSINKTLKAVSDPVRREILNILKDERMAAGDIVSHFDITGAAISRHLSILKDAELIRDSRDGKYIYFISQRGNASATANVWRMSFVF